MKLKLRYWRQKRALSIDDLAEKAEVSPQTIVSIEKGKEARPATIRKLATALDIDVAELIEPRSLAMEEPLVITPKSTLGDIRDGIFKWVNLGGSDRIRKLRDKIEKNNKELEDEREVLDISRVKRRLNSPFEVDFLTNVMVLAGLGFENSTLEELGCIRSKSITDLDFFNAILSDDPFGINRYK